MPRFYSLDGSMQLGFTLLNGVNLDLECFSF
jgi:hypothetical protein